MDKLKKAGLKANLALYEAAIKKEDWRGGGAEKGEDCSNDGFGVSMIRHQAASYKDAAKYCGAKESDFIAIEIKVLPLPCPQKMAEAQTAFDALKKHQRESKDDDKRWLLYNEVMRIERTMTPREHREWQEKIKRK